MSIFPVRDVAKYGVITDQDSYDIPTEAWSLACNVRFQNRKVTRGPVWRAVAQPLSESAPRFVCGNTFNTGQDNLFIGYESGDVKRYLNGSETLFNPPDYTPATVDAIWTETNLAGLLYINRSDRKPWFLRSGDSNFWDFTLKTNASSTTSVATLSFASVPTWVQADAPVWDETTNKLLGYVLSTTTTVVTLTANLAFAVSSGDTITFGWPANTSANIIRALGGSICAYNITQGGVASPTAVWTSNFPTAGNPPSTFLAIDGAGTPTDATQNILPEFQGSILDAMPLGNNMYIYGENEVWVQSPIGGTEIWDYQIAFDNRGVINSNCVVEFNGLHFVFGTDDVWMHNGVVPSSICNDRIREFIFGNLNYTLASRCHVRLNRPLQEIMFCFFSGDSLAKYPSGTDGCNRSATYDVARDRWTFDDTPLVMFGGRANLDNSLTYATVTSTYQTVGGTYQSLDDSVKKATVFVGIADAIDGLQNTLYAFDPVGPLSQVTAPIDTKATQPAFLQRDGIDLDQVGADLKGYKICQSIYPQGRLASGAQPLQFAFGSNDYFNQPAQYSAFQTWDGNTLYKLDYGVAGRFLSMQVMFNDVNFFSITGFDLELDIFGER